MRPSDAAELLLLAAIWGASFLFRLIAHVGPARAIAVTFLIPPFAVAWGSIFLGEPITGRLAAGSAVVLLGTALATGLLRLPAPDRAAAPPRA